MLKAPAVSRLASGEHLPMLGPNLLWRRGPCWNFMNRCWRYEMKSDNATLGISPKEHYYQEWYTTKKGNPGPFNTRRAGDVVHSWQQCFNLNRSHDFLKQQCKPKMTEAYQLERLWGYVVQANIREHATHTANSDVQGNLKPRVTADDGTPPPRTPMPASSTRTGQNIGH